MTAARRALLLISFIGLGSAQVSPIVTGSVCVASGAFDAVGRGAALPGEKAVKKADTPQVRYVQIDKLPPVRVSSTQSGQITSVPAQGTHRITISRNADMSKPVEQFSFSFQARESTNLCLWYRSFYASWILQPSRGSPCRCS